MRKIATPSVIEFVGHTFLCQIFLHRQKCNAIRFMEPEIEDVVNVYVKKVDTGQGEWLASRLTYGCIQYGK